MADKSNNNTPAVEVSHVVKSYDDKVVVDDLSFAVNRGEIFGIIGPNGAGKTTTIRMMMDIIKPDSGEIAVLGERLREETKDKLGYLPEERGLYRKLPVMDVITYLASLKGMNRHAAEARADELLEQTGMMSHKGKKIEQLSRGMSQIIQFIVTIIHGPELVILDEPLAGLDPVNADLMRGMFTDLRKQGTTLILSTHQMNEVEELCDRVLMINHGRSVLYGNLDEIKARFRSNSVRVGCEGKLGEVPGVVSQRAHRGYVELTLDSKTTPRQVLEYLMGTGLTINRFEVATPPLNEIFLRVVGERNEE
jgi:ABC-2 type transport system ATP-binding protein